MNILNKASAAIPSNAATPFGARRFSIGKVSGLPFENNASFIKRNELQGITLTSQRCRRRRRRRCEEGLRKSSSHRNKRIKFAQFSVCIAGREDRAATAANLRHFLSVKWMRRRRRMGIETWCFLLFPRERRRSNLPLPGTPAEDGGAKLSLSYFQFSFAGGKIGKICVMVELK